VPKQHIQPPELFESQRFGYTQVVTSSPGTHIFISGQTGLDAGFQLVGEGDLGAQTEQALRNLGHALAAAGASVADLTSLRIYVLDYRAESMAAVGGPLSSFLGSHPPPAQTLIGVQALGMPGLLVEIEATAVI